ncbi:hypothetical protein DK37_13210 [Halomonas sp. SUBG004]|nr:hypothetical protein DK37_13210 [Halomonas sp. SUBG004]
MDFFFDWQKAILNEVGSIKKVAWVIWGGDIYRYQEPTNEMLKLVEKIACIATVTSDDYKVYERLFGQKEALLILLIDSLFDELDKKLTRSETKK